MKIKPYELIKILFLLILVVSYYILPIDMRGFSRYSMCFYFFCCIGYLKAGYPQKFVLLAPKQGKELSYYTCGAFFVLYLIMYIPTTAFYYINIPVFLLYALQNNPFRYKNVHL